MEETPILKAIKEIKKISFWQEKVVVYIFIISLTINLFLWFFIFLKTKNLSEITILHYSVIPGVGLDRIGPKKYLFEMPLVGLVILFLNFILTNFLFQRGEKLLGYFFGLASFLVNLSVLAATILILTL
ncbi:MAG: hypothetical protein N2259_00280 [Patescibacteria group bacterium]|nr:hypothetical protein [Patescibacteria group bacterium]